MLFAALVPEPSERNTPEPPWETILTAAAVPRSMDDKPASGELFGIPYNFERPSVKRLLSSYWQPGEGMLVKKPFGIGYTLNLANWRSWVVLGVAGALFFQQRRGEDDEFEDDDDEEEPVEVIVD